MTPLERSMRSLVRVYDGDWHSRLMNACLLAEKEAISFELQASIKAFREVLVQNDECVQRVTVTKPLPKGMDFNFACKHVQAESEEGEVITCHTEDPTQVTITLVRRGGLPYVSRRADSIVHYGLRSATVEFSRID